MKQLLPHTEASQPAAGRLHRDALRVLLRWPRGAVRQALLGGDAALFTNGRLAVSGVRRLWSCQVAH